MDLLAKFIAYALLAIILCGWFASKVPAEWLEVQEDERHPWER